MMSLKFKRLFAVVFLICASFTAPAYVLTNITVCFTNSIFGTSNYMTITVNGDTRTFTNQVFVPSTQILTNSTQAGSASALLSHLATYPFSGVSISQSATTNVVLTSTVNDGPMIVSVTSGWAVLLTNSPNFGNNVAVLVPDPYTQAQRTNVYSGIAADINSSANTNGVQVTPLTPGGTNSIGWTRFTNAAPGHFLFQPLNGPISNSDDAGTFTNLPIVTSVDVPIVDLFTNNLGDGSSLTPGAFDWITNAGPGVVMEHTNGTTHITNIVRFRKSLPWDWDGGAVRVGLVGVCSGTNSVLATNFVWAVRAAALSQATDLSNPTFGSLVRTTNNVGVTNWIQGTEGITPNLTIGGSPSSSKGILWELQRHGGDGGDTETNAELLFSQIRIYYQSNTRTNLPSQSP